MSPTPEVIEKPNTSLALLNPQSLIEKAIETGAGIETMERLVALATQIREVQAREAWYEAMAAFQQRCPAIKKTKEAKIATRSGPGYSYRYAGLDDILNVIQPIMGDLGLSVAWRMRVDGDRVIANCRVSHTLGHVEESGEIPMPVQLANAEVGANPMQRVGIATTYAKRYALLCAIGMAPEDDPDGKHEDKGGGQGGSRPGGAGGGQDDQRGGDGGDPEAVISEGQGRRFYAIARGTKPTGWSEEQIHELLTRFQYASSKAIKVQDYDAMVERLKLGPVEGLKVKPAAPAAAPAGDAQQKLA